MLRAPVRRQIHRRPPLRADRVADFCIRPDGARRAAHIRQNVFAAVGYVQRAGRDGIGVLDARPAERCARGAKIRLPQNQRRFRSAAHFTGRQPRRSKTSGSRTLQTELPGKNHVACGSE